MSAVSNVVRPASACAWSLSCSKHQANIVLKRAVARHQEPTSSPAHQDVVEHVPPVATCQLPAALQQDIERVDARAF